MNTPLCIMIVELIYLYTWHASLLLSKQILCHNTKKGLFMFHYSTLKIEWWAIINCRDLKVIIYPVMKQIFETLSIVSFIESVHWNKNYCFFKRILISMAILLANTNYKNDTERFVNASKQFSFSMTSILILSDYPCTTFILMTLGKIQLAMQIMERR